MFMIRPLPLKIGVGFMSPVPATNEEAEGYRYERVGEHYHNYHVTEANWDWPEGISMPDRLDVVDGFSPNLNKSLHVGHLRNLALANALKHLMPNAKFVAMLGASQGVKKAALDGWRYWLNFLGYHPTEYFDITLPNDMVECEEVKDPERLEFGSFVWKGPSGEVIVKRSDGSPVYAFHDATFAAYVGPTHYITGHEQKEHFEKLGLGKKHYPMGLVLGDDGKKLKSRSGDALPASELMTMIMQRLNGEEDTRRKLAWNILAWNFLRTGRDKNIKFDVESWTRPEQGGLYVTYTYARVMSALNKTGQHLRKLYREQMETPFEPDDIALLGLSEQYKFYYQRSIDHFDPSPLANFAFELAQQISRAYENHQIRGGRRSFQQSIEHALWRLEEAMRHLGMFLLPKV